MSLIQRLLCICRYLFLLPVEAQNLDEFCQYAANRQVGSPVEVKPILSTPAVELGLLSSPWPPPPVGMFTAYFHCQCVTVLNNGRKCVYCEPCGDPLLGIIPSAQWEKDLQIREGQQDRLITSISRILRNRLGNEAVAATYTRRPQIELRPDSYDLAPFA